MFEYGIFPDGLYRWCFEIRHLDGRVEHECSRNCMPIGIAKVERRLKENEIEKTYNHDILLKSFYRECSPYISDFVEHMKHVYDVKRFTKNSDALHDFYRREDALIKEIKEKKEKLEKLKKSDDNSQ